MATRGAPWTEETETLLGDWADRSAAAKRAHYRLVDRYRAHHHRLGIPVVMLSSLVGTSLFATLSEPEVSQLLRLMAGLVSIVAAVLAGVQTFLRFSERAERHMVAADWYAACQRRIEQILSLPREGRPDPVKCLDEIRKEMARIGQHSPEINARLWDETAELLKLREASTRPLPSG